MRTWLNRWETVGHSQPREEADICTLFLAHRGNLGTTVMLKHFVGGRQEILIGKQDARTACHNQVKNRIQTVGVHMILALTLNGPAGHGKPMFARLGKAILKPTSTQQLLTQVNSTHEDVPSMIVFEPQSM